MWALGQIISEVMGGSAQEIIRGSEANEVAGVNFWPVNLGVDTASDALSEIIKQCLRMPDAADSRPIASELRAKLIDVKDQLEKSTDEDGKPPPTLVAVLAMNLVVAYFYTNRNQYVFGVR